MLQTKLRELLHTIFPAGGGTGTRRALSEPASRTELTPEASQPSADRESTDELAVLSPEEQQRRTEQRRQYERFAQHMGLVEVEDQADQARRQ